MQRLRNLLIATLTICYACSPAYENKEETDALGYRTVWLEDPETGLRQGETKEYDPQGNLLAEALYVDGVLDGKRIIYYPNGTVQREESYRAGAYEGAYVAYDSSGAVAFRGQYVDGAMNKAWSYFYPNGALKEVVTFVDNEENGPFREWYPNGKPKASGSYLDGDDEDGVLHLYAESGELERVMNCEAGICATAWTPDSTAAAPPGPDMTLPKYSGPGHQR